MLFSTAVLYVDDGTVSEVLAFYERAFNLERRFYDPEYEYGELAAGPATIAVAAHAAGARIMGRGYPTPPPLGGVANAELAFTTNDVYGAFAQAVAAGAEPLTEPYAVPWGQTVAYVRSVEGTIIGLCTPLAEADAPSSDGVPRTEEP